MADFTRDELEILDKAVSQHIFSLMPDVPKYSQAKEDMEAAQRLLLKIYGLKKNA